MGTTSTTRARPIREARPRKAPRANTWALFCVFALLWGFAAGSATAQGTGDIVGAVFDANSAKPLPFANVGVVDATLGSNTDTTGRFAIRNLRPGTYRLRASFIGYEPQELTVTVEAFGATEAYFGLRKKAAAGVTEKVLVTAERPLVDVSEISTVREQTAEDINKLAVDNLSDIVERQVGVAGEDQQLHIRGGRSDETMYRIENVAMKNVLTGAAVGGTFSAKAIQNLQVITGGYEAELGQAISGVVKVELKEGGDEFRTHMESQVGSFSTGRVFLQTEGPLLPLDGSYPIPGKMSFLLGVDYLATDTYLPSLRHATNFGSTRRTLHSQTTASFAGLSWDYNDFMRPRQGNNMNFYTKLTWSANPRHRVNATFTKFVAIDHGFFRYRIGDEALDAASLSTPYNYAFRDQMDQFLTFSEITTSQAVNWRWATGASAFASLTFSHFYNETEEAVQGKRPWIAGQEYEAYSRDDEQYFIQDENGDFPYYQNVFQDRFGFEGSYTHRWQEHHEFKGGITANYHTLQMITIRNPTAEGTGGLGNVRDLYRVYPNEGSFFVQNRFSYEGFTGHVGLRGDYLFLGKAADRAAAQDLLIGPDYYANTNSLFGYRYKLFWSPRLAVNHPITDRDAIHFNFGHFVQNARLIYYYAKISSRSSEAFPVEGNLDLEPERSVQFELGVKHQFSNDDAVDVTIFNKDIYDYPFASRPIAATRQRFVYTNDDFSRARGIEIVYRHRGDRRMNGSLSYEYQIATGKPADPNRIKQVDPEALETGDFEGELNEQFMPWNRPHRIQASLDVRFRPGDAPRLGGLQLPDRWGMNFFYTLRSGKPYTPTDIRGQRTGKYNSANAPAESIFDLKLDKYWQPWKTGRFGLMLEIRNLFNQAPLRRVDSSTGEAPELGKGRYTFIIGERPEVVNDALSNPAFYGEGRNVRFGMELSF